MPASRGGERDGGRSARVVAEVLKATALELGRVGYIALRVDDVAQRAGVNKTTIYRRWPKKADLVSAALRREEEAVFAAPDTGTVRGDLLAMLFPVIERGKSPMIRVLMAEMAHPEVQAIANGLRHNYESRWVTVLARGMARGELPLETEPLLLMEVITAAVVGRVCRGEEAPDEAFCERIVDLVLAGARTVGHDAGRTLRG